MKNKIVFLLFWSVIVGASAVQAQTYSPFLILNSSNVETSAGKYSDHSPGSSAGFGLAIYWPAFAGLNYRGLVALQSRKFELTYNDGLDRRHAVGTLDLGVGLSTEILEMFGLFAGIEATVLPLVECRGPSPCNEKSGDMFAGQLQLGFSLGPSWLKFEPYYEYMPFSPVSGTKSMTTYGFGIHFFPESFNAE